MLLNSLTYLTIYAAVLLYAVALSCRLYAFDDRLDATARLFWTVGCMFYITHVACAFEVFYQWSHAVAYRQTERQTAAMIEGATGAGIYWNYVFTAIWVLDVAWWWRGLDDYRARPRWVKITIQGFMGFMVFNGAVVFAKGNFRYAAAMMTVLLVGLAARRLRK